jgi:hypothetical protein
VRTMNASASAIAYVLMDKEASARAGAGARAGGNADVVDERGSEAWLRAGMYGRALNGDHGRGGRVD